MGPDAARPAGAQGPRRVGVTGLGFATCLGNDRAAVLGALREQRHGIRVFPPLARDGIPVRLAAPVQGFETDSPDPEDWTFPEELKLQGEQLRGMAPHGLYAAYAVDQALREAGLDAEQVSDPRTGLFTASAGSPERTYHHLHGLLTRGVARSSPQGVLASVAGTLTFTLGARHRIRGASAGFVSACASSAHALGYAHDEIALGRQDRIIVVGGEDCTLESILPFAVMRVLTCSPDPDRASRPFDRRRDGFVLTGGAVAMVLEDEETARSRGAPIQARLRGWGQASDGYHAVKSHPDGDGLARAMQGALAAARLTPEEVDYVNAHAPSTKAGDLSELRALKRVFRQGGGPAVSSTKALTGHGLSLAGILEAAFCVLALHEGFMPGSAHLEEPDPEANGVELLRHTVPRRPAVALSNSSGFGGANVALVFEASAREPVRASAR